jgi:hypothetical protein
MNYTYHASLTGGYDYFKKMYQFLLAQGWTINEFRDANSLWDTAYPYGWKAGTESFLDVQAPVAYHCGTQKLRFNLRHYNINTTTDGINHGAVDPTHFSGDWGPAVTLTGTTTYAEVTFANPHGLVAGNYAYVTGMGITGNDIRYRPGASPAGFVTVLASGLTTTKFRYTIYGAPTNSPALGNPVCMTQISSPPSLQQGTSSATSPYHIWGPYTRASGFSLPKNSFTGCWFFENGYSFWSVIQPTAGTCFLWGFGRPNLTAEYANIMDFQQVFPANYMYGDWTLLATEADNINGTSWWSGEGFPGNTAGGMVWTPLCRAEGVADITMNLYYNLCLPRHSRITCPTYFDSMNTSVLLNTFNNIRPGIVPDVYLQRATTGIWECIGSLPLAKIRSTGLSIGTHLLYGTEEYIAFPNLSATNSLYGTILRVA